MKRNLCAATRIAAAMAALLAVGCSGGFVSVAPTPQGNTKLGHVEGSGCGSILLGPTLYNFIPVGLNDRVKTAYYDALSKAPGATGLVDVTLHENWFWWVIGSTHCVYIEGEATK